MRISGSKRWNEEQCKKLQIKELDKYRPPYIITKAKHSRMWWTGNVAGIQKTNAYEIALKKFVERHPYRRPIGQRIIFKVC